MRKSRFTEEQIIAMLTEHERGLPTAEVCRKHGISAAAEIEQGPAHAAQNFVLKPTRAASPSTAPEPSGAVSPTVRRDDGRWRIVPIR
jgi:hypothetical protein